MMEYQVISWYDVNTLTERVNREIKNGWEPIGGIGISVVPSERFQDRYTFYQAMVKKVSSDKS